MDTDNKGVRELYSEVSGQFLTDCIPEDYFDLSEEDQNEFLDDHVWQPFEYWRTEDVWNLIDSATVSMYRFLKYKGVTL